MVLLFSNYNHQVKNVQEKWSKYIFASLVISNYFRFIFLIKTGTILHSDNCQPRLGLLDTGCFFFEDTTKQKVTRHHNKRFHKSTFSARNPCGSRLDSQASYLTGLRYNKIINPLHHNWSFVWCLSHSRNRSAPEQPALGNGLSLKTCIRMVMTWNLKSLQFRYHVEHVPEVGVLRPSHDHLTKGKRKGW